MRTRPLVQVLNYQTDKPVPPDVSMWDQTPSEQAESEQYCRDLERAMWEYEMNPRNFFRLNKAR